ncbi:hypothetical protein SELSPUOL_00171 [Selenomonas sputigena ATCC 35185]|uniref:Uncharacterized protein n=1 Tax=Selenomonas sputigena (strain ATCC 35185 / DSM 20758 / CCUG 44933 / VPI D19B-28) TaxID=546271 RepID=C9LRV1_SELS3|nr:hypothetical protein SELSPUOL_00171 [Selenomonas sputigena ATCC 35185]
MEPPWIQKQDALRKKEDSERFLFICRATRVISVHFLTSFP